MKRLKTLFSALLIAFLGLAIYIGPANECKTALMAGYHHELTIIIDRAHGVNTAGKGSPDGRHKEWQWSEVWSAELGRHLSDIGFTVVYTCENDSEPGLWNRVNLMNKVPAPAVVLSLHNNAAGMGLNWTAARGFSVWTTKGLTRSDKCAEIIYNNFRAVLPDLPFRSDFSDGDPDFESNFIVLLSRHPSVLLEYMFQDNELDLLLIENPQLSRTMVEIIDISLIQIERYLIGKKQISHEKNYLFGPALRPCSLQPSKAA